MQTSEIVRRLLSRPVTDTRALKVLHLLTTPEQVQEVIDALPDATDQSIVQNALTDSVVARHFASRSR